VTECAYLMLCRCVFLGRISCWEWRHTSPTALFQAGYNAYYCDFCLY